MYLILMVYACLISCSFINKSKCHFLAYFNLRWTFVVILHKSSHWQLKNPYEFGGFKSLSNRTVLAAS